MAWSSCTLQMGPSPARTAFLDSGAVRLPRSPARPLPVQAAQTLLGKVTLSLFRQAHPPFLASPPCPTTPPQAPASPTWSPKVCSIESYAPRRLPGGALHCKGLAFGSTKTVCCSYVAELGGVHVLAQVVSKKAEKTVIVAVEQLKTHRIYGKRMRQTHRFQACLYLALSCMRPRSAIEADWLVTDSLCCAVSSAVCYSKAQHV